MTFVKQKLSQIQKLPYIFTSIYPREARERNICKYIKYAFSN